MRLLASLIILLVPVLTWGTTYYVDSSRADDDGNGTSWAQAKKYIASGIGLMSGGDTLILAPGGYTDDTNDLISNVPSGNASAYTVIKSSTDWQAVMNNMPMFAYIDGSAYVQLEGIKFSTGTGDDYQNAVDIVSSNHIKVLRCAFVNPCATNTDYGSALVFDSESQYCLAEDCWVVGRFRYGFCAYQSEYNIFRRCVARWDANTGNQPKASFNVYGAVDSIVASSHTYLQNCISLDSNSNAQYAGCFSLTHGTKNTYLSGCIALNDPSNAVIMGEDGTARNTQLENCVSWDCVDGFVVKPFVAASSHTIVNCTVGKTTDAGYGGVTNWGETHGGTVNIWNCLFSSNAAANTEFEYDDYNQYNPASMNPDGSTNEITTDSGLKYLCRIEDGATGKGTGRNGGDRGANIIYKIGTSGTLYGDAGWNTVSTDALWPWPYESTIKSDFTINGSRDMTLADSLTEYIWEYLGNTIPADIYGSEAPAATSKSPLRGTVTLRGVTIR